MDPITPIPRSEYVQNEFSRIAERYELMNQIMTFGFVNTWRKNAIRLLDVRAGQVVLDLAAGGGQLTLLLKQAHPDCQVYPSDFNLPMMRVGQTSGLPFYAADALKLPHPDASVDRVICAFLLRNVEQYPLVLDEILRVLKPGGRFVCLDTTPPTNPILKPFIRLYMRIAIPLIGSLVTGRFSAYNYLIRSSEGFALAEKLAEDFRHAGFGAVQFKRIMFGTAAIHWGDKPG
jgi:demethylmenaquinone methyltransferase/2-methoxy-6-polyprenyl-1,4-benzoquinol methylase